jgi:hypothetical protein
MVSTPVRSWARPAAVASGGVAMVCLASAWHTPVSTDTAQPASLSATSSAASAASGATVRLVAEVTSLRSGWPAAGGPGGGLGGGPGGGSDGSPGDAVAPSPAKHQSSGGSSSSASGGSVSGQGSSSRDSGPVETAFSTVGRWLGLSHDSPSSSDASSELDSTAGLPKPGKSAGAGAEGSADKSSAPSSTSGVGDMIHSVVSGVGRLIGGLFGH